MEESGVSISNKLLSLLRMPSPDVLYSIQSTLDFVEALKLLIDHSGIEVEPKECGKGKRDVDVKAVVDGKTIAFQVKSLHPFKSKVMQEIMKSTEEFTGKYLTKYGIFVKAIFIPQQNLIFRPRVIEYRKVNANVNVSYGSLLYPVDLLTQWIQRRVINRIKRSYRQLRDVDTDYRVVVIDVRREPVNEFTLWYSTQLWLGIEGDDYPKLSGVIFMRYDITSKKDQVSTWLIPVINPYAETPLDPKLLLKNIVLPTPSFGARYLLILPTHIYIPKPGWMDLIQLEPEFKLTYKGIYFGTII